MFKPGQTVEAGPVVFSTGGTVSNTGLALHKLGVSTGLMGAKIVVLKIGDWGLYLRTANATALTHMGRSQVADVVTWSDRELWAPCFATHVVGTTGSGDATIAAF